MVIKKGELLSNEATEFIKTALYEDDIKDVAIKTGYDRGTVRKIRDGKRRVIDKNYHVIEAILEQIDEKAKFYKKAEKIVKTIRKNVA